jgi:ABC-2 type transport system permease protein
MRNLIRNPAGVLAGFKPYAGLFRMRFIAGMQYRAAAWAGVATQFFWGGIELLIYAAFYRSAALSAGTSAPVPLAFSQLADLIWLRQAFLALVMLWSQDTELLDLIVSGTAAYELCRPLSLYFFWFSRLMAARVSRTLLRCFPILFVAFLLPEPWAFHPPPTGEAAFLFFLSIFFAAFIVCALSMFIYLLTFITLTGYGSRLAVGVAGEFLMGALIPIPFMPEGLQRILSWLPFRYTADFPFRVYSGSICGGEALWGIGIQVFWIVLLVSGGVLGFRSILKGLVIQGG